jgi:hypothetical protein
MLALRALDPSAPNFQLQGLTLIPNERGDLPIVWNVDSSQATPLQEKPVIKATFQMAFAPGQEFEGQLCVPRLLAIAADVGNALGSLQDAMI